MTLVMDRENPAARGWSHVLSLADDVAALDAFRRRVGAPPSALQLPPKASRPHLDICRAPRQRALALDGDAVRVFDRSTDMMRAYRAARAPQPPAPAARASLSEFSPASDKVPQTAPVGREEG